MKYILATLLLLLSTLTAHADFKTVCPQVKNVKAKDLLYKSVPSEGIQSSDKRTTGPALICGKVCPERFPVGLWFSDGTLATKLGYYGLYAGNNRPRAYCAVGKIPQCFNSKLNDQSNLPGRDGFLYLRINKLICYKVSPVGRSGSL